MGLPRLIGIAGPSGAGKSYLASHLAAALGGATILTLDSYYPDLSHVPLYEREATNFDAPESLDHELLISHVRRLASGSPIERPVYDFQTHTRTGQFERVDPAPYILVEGLYALYWPSLRELYATRVYVDMTDNVCLTRRLERDMRERGRTSESIFQQYRHTVAPMADAHVRPTARFADVLLFGGDRVEDEVAAVLRHLFAAEKPAFPDAGA